MHPNSSFRKETRDQNIDFARERSFGTLAINAETSPLLSHIPFQLSPNGAFLEAHLVRSNPILRLLKTPIPAVVSIIGPHGYVSPDWYGVEDQVPTWNYIAVHLRGELRRLEQEELRGIIDRLSENMERRLLPKTPWTSGKMTPDVLEKMMRQIVPIALDVTEINGTWKLNQNKADEVIARAAMKTSQSPVGSETKALAKLMDERNL